MSFTTPPKPTNFTSKNKMEILSEFIRAFGTKAAFIAIVYVLVLILIMLDLWSGVMKSKRKKDYISSYGLQKTLNKIARYYNMLFAITVIDVIQMIAIYYSQHNGSVMFLPIIPLFTFFAAIFIGVIEAKSIYEKAEQKDKAKSAEVVRFIREALKDSETSKIIQNIIKEREENENSN